MSGDKDAAEDFKDTFKGILATYDEDDVYNADESGLLWKALPNKSLVLRGEKTPGGYKPSKERVTIMVCGNASGFHRIPLMLIGISANPHCWKKRNVPARYYNSKNAWMTTTLFVEWYDKIFIPSVEAHQEKRERISKVLLILDNAPVHPAAKTLERQGGRFQVQYLPPNVTSLIQPMDQTVIASLKRNYRRMILADLIRKDDEIPISRKDFLTQYKLKDALYNIETSWDAVKNSTLQASWSKLRGKEDEVPVYEINEDEWQYLQWFLCDEDDQGYEDLNDDDLIEEVIGEADEEQDENIVNETTNDLEIKVTAKEAADGLKAGLSWLNSLEESHFYDKLRLSCLDFATKVDEKQKLNAKKQTGIKNFFPTTE